MGFLWFISLLFVSSAQAESSASLELSFAKESGHWISEWGEIPMPEGISAFQIFAFGSKNSPLQVSDLVDPQGEVWVASGPAAGKPLTIYHQPILSGALSPNRSEAVVPGFASLLVPNQLLKTSISPGRWRFRVYSHKEPEQKTAKIQWIWKKNRSPGTVGVQVWVSQRSIWKDRFSELQKIFANVKKTYLEVGIDLEFSEPLFVEMPEKLPMSLPEDMANIAMALNRVGKLNLYFMPEMEYQSKPMNGLACIGGPIVISEQHPCFAAVFAGEKLKEVSFLQRAKIVAHELGHYFGLHHTQDTGYHGLKVVHDSFDDTPAEVTGTNLMDPGIHRASPTLSPQQKEVLLFHPGIR